MHRLFLALAMLATLSALAVPATAQDEKKVVLRWYGHAFFQIETNTGQKIVIDPHAIPEFGSPVVKADFVLISHPMVDHNQHEVLEGLSPDPKKRLNDIYYGVTTTKTGKQEWNAIDEKRGAVRFRTLATYHDTVNGKKFGKNAIWIVETDGLVFCHLGDLGHKLSDDQVKAIGPVDVLMIPVGGVYSLNGEMAKRVADQIKPRLYILPMHYGFPGFDDLLPPDEFLDGQKNVKKLPTTNELVIPTNLKADSPTVVMLGWKKEDPIPKKPQ